MIEPPCTERYARWCERSATQLMGSLLLDYALLISGVLMFGPWASLAAMSASRCLSILRAALCGTSPKWPSMLPLFIWSTQPMLFSIRGALSSSITKPYLSGWAITRIYPAATRRFNFKIADSCLSAKSNSTSGYFKPLKVMSFPLSRSGITLSVRKISWPLKSWMPRPFSYVNRRRVEILSDMPSLKKFS